MNLAIKYRPKTFEDVVSQKEIIDILQHQINTRTTKNSYLFVGPSGCGKTTVARILANELNGGSGQPFEIDAASNTGVDNVRKIIEQASFKSINSEYKVFIIDECHMLSTGAWNALLKILEEPPAHAIFILATTDAQKIIPTVLSRVQRFDFTRIPKDRIIKRLRGILQSEGILAYEDKAIETIANQSKGGLRTAISLLDKTLDYSGELSYSNVCLALGILSDSDIDSITNYVMSKDQKNLLSALDTIYLNGKDMKQLLKTWIERVLSLQKTCIINGGGCPVNYLGLLDTLVYLNNYVKFEDDPKTIIEAELILYINTLQ